MIVTEDSVYLKCRLFRKKFTYSDIRKVCTYSEITNSIRNFGSNGIWGYIGFLDNGKFKFFSLTNNEKKSILVFYKEKHYVISCNESEKLINHISRFINYSDSFI
ncbi:MAG: PH domain-containing protein [Dysgonamonadaceae bacterium]|nr:PH domain-containing protein [Dysgonamonadaceae bacterium]